MVSFAVCNFFLNDLYDILLWISADNIVEARKLQWVFSLMNTFASLILAPISAWTLRSGFVIPILLLTVAFLVVGTLTLVPSLNAQYATFAFWVFINTEFVSILFTYALTAFGSTNWAALVGLTWVVSAMLSLVNYPLTAYAKKTTNQDGFFVIIPIIIAIAAGTGLVFACFLARCSKMEAIACQKPEHRINVPPSKSELKCRDDGHDSYGKESASATADQTSIRASSNA